MGEVTLKNGKADSFPVVSLYLSLETRGVWWEGGKRGKDGLKRQRQHTLVSKLLLTLFLSNEENETSHEAQFPEKKKNDKIRCYTSSIGLPLIILAAGYCRPKPRPCFILCAHWDEIQERSIGA